MGADVFVDEALVAGLIAEQHPECVGPVRWLSEGWDNVVFRVGDTLAARMPRRQLGAENVVREQQNVPRLPPLPLPHPAQARIGRPGRGYPYPWSLVEWVEGEVVGTSTVAPRQLAAFLAALHVPSHPRAPTEAARSMPLLQRAEAVEERLKWVDAGMRSALRHVWAQATGAEPHAGPPLWCHGDLHPFNLVQHRGELCGVLDWGDLFGGDPAPDLAAVWMLFEPDLHGLFRSQVPGPRWQRGRGWALYFGVTLLDAHHRGASAAFGAIGTLALERLVRTA